ncbi:MAG TPA: DegT/DnrJ/EryC1/StrS family aminotransferase [Bacteroidota bacterium]|nr:DegT/DnrJ/EryC1/StrS family aminotransferase [Bacteroidota bacterium]
MKDIAFVDLKRNYLSIRDEVEKALHDVMERTAFILGSEVRAFEEEFAAYCGAKYCIGVASGTDALKIALKAVGVMPGDEVITVANTFIATALAISESGATPVLVDCDPHYYAIDPDRIEKAITEKTKAIIPVHLYGQIAEMEKIETIAKKYGLKIIEDACQAHGTMYHGKKAGTFGDVGCFSFYPGKNLGAFGDAGAITTDNAELAEKTKLLRDYGQRIKYFHDLKGYNSRLDTVQAAVLRVKLKHLDKWNKKRKKNADLYGKYLSGIEEIKLPQEREGSTHVYHLYVIRVNGRQKIMDELKSKGISCGIHYPIPIHLQQAYADLGLHKGIFPVSEAYAEQVLSLPMFPELQEDEIDYISECFRRTIRST